MRISAVIPIYNNEVSVAHVARVLTGHPGVDEVIAVDDGSTDGSAAAGSGVPGGKLVRFAANLGKGAGIVAGWHAASHDHILTVDADISRLRPDHVTDLISTYRAGKWDMVLSVNEYRFNIFASVTGQRIYRKQTDLPFVRVAETVGNGIEQVINHAHRGKRFKRIIARNVGHLLKHHKNDPLTAAVLYAREGWQIARTEVVLLTRQA